MDIATDGKKTLTKGLRRYGDKFNRVNLFVMHSTTYFDIVDQAIDNKVYKGVVIYGGQPGTLGKPVLATDTAPVDAIFGLVPGAVTITESQEPTFHLMKSMTRRTWKLVIVVKAWLTLAFWAIAGMNQKEKTPI